MLRNIDRADQSGLLSPINADVVAIDYGEHVHG